MIIEGKNISFRLAQLEDAEFILSVRLDERISRYLSRVDDNLEQQISWLRDYKVRESDGAEYYFIIENKQGEKLGTVRLYDFRDDSFSWGSWIIKAGVPSNVALESVLLVYEFAFKSLKFSQTHFEVMKENHKVRDFHLRFGAKIVDSDETKNYFIFSKAEYGVAYKKYSKYLPV